MNINVSSVVFRWDHARQALAAEVTSDVGNVCVYFPVAIVQKEFNLALRQLGYHFLPSVGEYVTIEGFFSWVKKATKKVGRAMKSAARTVGHKLAKVAKLAKPLSRLAKGIARSKLVGTALGGVATVFPAVGAPALAAWAAAHRGVVALDQAEAAAKRIKKGIHNASDLVAVRNAKQLVAGARKLAGSAHPAAKLAAAALRSVPDKPTLPTIRPQVRAIVRRPVVRGVGDIEIGALRPGYGRAA